MEPVTMGALIAGGAAIAGGLIGADSTDKTNARNEQLQRDFAQKGIQWRVADAKAAGIHPLAALGASVPSASPSFVAGDLGESVARAGQHIGDYVSRSPSAEQRALTQLQMEQIKASTQKDLAQANYWNSEAARHAQKANAVPSGTPGVDIQPVQATHITGTALPAMDAVPRGLIKGKAADQNSSRPGDRSTVAAENPLWQSAVFKEIPGRAPMRIVIPHSDDLGEMLSEGVPSHLLPEVARRSAAESKMSITEWLQHYFLGSAPLSEFSDKYQAWRKANHERNMARQPVK